MIRSQAGSASAEAVAWFLRGWSRRSRGWHRATSEARLRGGRPRAANEPHWQFSSADVPVVTGQAIDPTRCEPECSAGAVRGRASTTLERAAAKLHIVHDKGDGESIAAPQRRWVP